MPSNAHAAPPPQYTTNGHFHQHPAPPNHQAEPGGLGRLRSLRKDREAFKLAVLQSKHAAAAGARGAAYHLTIIETVSAKRQVSAYDDVLFLAERRWMIWFLREYYRATDVEAARRYKDALLDKSWPIGFLRRARCC